METAYNRSALISLTLSLLTLIAFCIGAVPIPLTALICYPVALALAVAALVFGTRGLRQIRSAGGRGGWMAWAGLSLGGLMIFAVFCMTTLTAFFISQMMKYLSQIN
jgi:hypothetical protein